jgi:hypothetical protein
VIKFYTNRELAGCFGINLAKWKRWSREFLPPDPLAGKQAGYARQYYFNEAFTVFLGGHLVGKLDFSVPQAREILHDVEKWLNARGFRCDARGRAKPRHPWERGVQSFTLGIRVRSGHLRGYRMIGNISESIEKKGNMDVVNAVYLREKIEKRVPDNDPVEVEIEKRINLTALFNHFLERIDPGKQLFVHYMGGGDNGEVVI